MKLKFNTFLNFSILIVLSIFIGKFISNIGSTLLPSNSKIDIISESIPVNNIFFSDKNLIKAVIMEPNNVVATKTDSMKNIVLKAIYNSYDVNSFILIGDISNKDEKIISINENYNGYKLTQINNNSVAFEKDGNKFELNLITDEDKSAKIMPDMSKRTIDPVEVNSDTSFAISRTDIMKFSNSSDLSKAISFEQEKSGESILGYRITRIDSSSVFGKMGLNNGDIILTVDGQSTSDVKNLMAVINKLDTVSALNIEIDRNGERIGLNYEIN
jgi:general secretion pathway protein C